MQKLKGNNFIYVQYHRQTNNFPDIPQIKQVRSWRLMTHLRSQSRIFPKCNKNTLKQYSSETTLIICNTNILKKKDQAKVGVFFLWKMLSLAKKKYWNWNVSLQKQKTNPLCHFSNVFLFFVIVNTKTIFSL